MKVLVTGADSFIGSNLSEQLVREGHDVRAFVLYNSFNSWGWLDYCSPDVKGQFEIFAGDVRDPHGAIVNAFARVGNNCIINTRAIIEHQAVVEDHCDISTGVILNAGVSIGAGSFVGSGSVIMEGVSIGRGCVVGMGLSVWHDKVDHARINDPA